MANKDLLELLELPEDGFKIYLAASDIIKISEGERGEVVLDESLADLAFRMRDEVCKDSLSYINYHQALYTVYQVFRKSQEGTIHQNMVYYELWLESFITANERIVAALIARRLSERKEL